MRLFRSSSPNDGSKSKLNKNGKGDDRAIHTERMETLIGTFTVWHTALLIQAPTA